MVEASIFNEFWHDQIEANHQQAIFLVLIGFLLSFAFIRMSTRLMRSPKVPWWPGSIVSEGGLHVHHHVFGIVLMMISGAVGFAIAEESTAFNLCGLAFGIGIGLTIDEFALWLHLEDVYWSEEGRRSIDATVLTALVLALLMFGARPFEIGSDSLGILIGSILTALFVLTVVGICFLKERVMHGFVGFFIWPVALYGPAGSASRVRSGPSAATGKRTLQSRNGPRPVSVRTAGPRVSRRGSAIWSAAGSASPSDMTIRRNSLTMRPNRQTIRPNGQRTESQPRPRWRLASGSSAAIVSFIPAPVCSMYSFAALLVLPRAIRSSTSADTPGALTAMVSRSIAPVCEKRISTLRSSSATRARRSSTSLIRP